MKSNVLDRTHESVLVDTPAALSHDNADRRGSLGVLHDQAEKVDQTLLPCRANDPELWFAELPADVEYAKALCQACPVREMCLVGALERREPWGVWGGELFLQGAVIPRKRPRGRPRKDAAA